MNLFIKMKKFKMIVVLIFFVILICFGAILDGVSSQSNNSNIYKNGLQIKQYNNIIYKGGIIGIPFPEDGYVITSKFNPYRVHPISGVIRPHNGIDIVSINRESEIISIANGIVTISGFDKDGYGNWVEINHGDLFNNGSEVKTRYGHMRDIPLVKKGENIVAGTILGIQGMTGAATGVHLHFEIRIDGVPQNPIIYFFEEGENNV